MISLINVDSADRNKIPKNICNNFKQLPNNPINVFINSNKVNIYCEDHNLNVGDDIILRNSAGEKLVSGELIWLFNDFDYAVIDTLNIIMPQNLTTKVFVNIVLVGEQTIPNYIGNIPLGVLLGIKQIYTFSDINIIVSDDFNKFVQTKDVNKLIFISLNTKYINDTIVISQIFQIEHLHIGGIPLGYINADYPINDIYYQGRHTITNILSKDTFEIIISSTSQITTSGGGSNIIISNISRTIDGYPNPNDYVINLKNTYSNITDIRLVSMEMPYTDTLFVSNENNVLEWKNIKDGNTTYKIDIDAGFYTCDTLASKIETKINKTQRDNYSMFNPIYNNFTVSYDSSTNVFTFTSYEILNLPDSLFLQVITLNDEKYFSISVAHGNNYVEIGDTIEIFNAESIGSSIVGLDSIHINKIFTVYNKNVYNNTYDILLGKTREFESIILSNTSLGGKNVKIKTYLPISFLLNKKNTIGSILGWVNTGNKYSITEYKSILHTNDSYIFGNNVNSVGNPIYSNSFVNLNGKHNYLYMYLNDIEYIELTSNIKSPFSKVLLTGNPGETLFNTFINNTFSRSKSMPISSLDTLHVKFCYPDGSLVDFKNLDHSFTLCIITDNVTINYLPADMTHNKK